MTTTKVKNDTASVTAAIMTVDVNKETGKKPTAKVNPKAVSAPAKAEEKKAAKKAEQQKQEEKLEKTREERRVIREEFLEGDADYEDEVTFTADSVEDLIQQIENADNLYRRDILSQHERQVGRGFDFVV